MEEIAARCACWEVSLPPDEIEEYLARLRNDFSDSIVQIFSSPRTPNPAALEMIAAQTFAAKNSGSMLADKPEVDLLLRLALTTQIGEAFESFGYKTKKANKLFLVVAWRGRDKEEEQGDKMLWEELRKDDRLKQISPKEITEADLERVERAALLAAKT